ncbi:hypothetical protein DFP73DRAFT_619587 [Morchella snyderi]|nr:hypothetical protein DFP73DRAFT_619587 [Morchella snyderi]
MGQPPPSPPHRRYPTVDRQAITYIPLLRRVTTMGDDTEQQTKKRKNKWITSYSRPMTQADTEKRLGFRMRALKAIPADRMLANLEGEGPDALLGTKERMDEDFKEASINHLVYSIARTILFDLRCKTGRKSLHLRSTDGDTGGTEEFVVVDLISVTEEKFAPTVEAKRSSLGQAMRQCLLSMKDMRDNNTRGQVNGFVTTGEQWQMLKCDGALFQMMFCLAGWIKRTLFRSGGLHVRSVEQRRHCSGMTEGAGKKLVIIIDLGAKTIRRKSHIQRRRKKTTLIERRPVPDTGWYFTPFPSWGWGP